MSLISSQNLSRLRTRVLFLLAATLFSGWAMGQDDLNIHGVISDAMTSSKLGDVTVKVLKDGSSHDSYTTRANGKYEFYLDIGSHYELKFQKDGFVQRSIVIDSRNVPMEIVGAGIIMPTDMSMYEITPAMEGEDLSVFEEPIGKASYNPAEEDLSWDFQYTNQVKGEIFALMRAVEKKQKELDKAASDEQKALDELEAKFAQFVKDGDAAMNKKNYEDAVLNFQAALDLKPDDVSVQSKLGDAETKLNALRAEEELSANYNAALDAGDGFMRTEEFDKAIEQYEVALSLRPNEEYPQTQIDKANQIKEERAASLAKQEQFNEIMSRAETEMSEQQWAEAVDSYKEALTVIPDDREAQRKLEEAEQALQNAEVLAEKQAQYEDLIAKADLSFGSKDYPTAEGFYRQAQQVLPDETYPQEQIDKCLEFINQAEQAEALQAEFDALVQKGDDAAAQTKYALAIESYLGALNLLPDNQEVKSKLEDAQSLLAEKEAADKKQADYAALILEADDLFKDASYTEAKVKYQAAKDIIPEETYPLDQITKIDKLLQDQAAQAEAEATYATAMEAGKAALSSQSYSEAVGQFELALSAKPEDKEATKSLDEAKELLAEFEANKAVEEQYNTLISSADEKMANEQLNDAIADYQAALDVKPKEDYPKSQIELIEQMIAEREAEAAENERQAQIEAQYNEFMASGESKLEGQDYAGAIEQFNFALEVKPNDELATSKKEEAESKLSQAELLAQKQKEYDDLVQQADELFAAKSWNEAIVKYEAANQVIPEEDYPKNQIDLIREEIAMLEQAELDRQEAEKAEQVRQLVLEGDRLISEQSYVEGVDKYEEALGIAPDRTDIQQKIDEATQAYLAYQEASALQEAYDSEIAEADKQFESENWERAKASYNNALEIKPEETYPANQITIIDERIAALAEAADLERRQQIQAQFDEFIADGDKKFEKNKYDRALESYENALDLIPDSELALEKISAVNQALGAISDAEESRKRYELLIEEGDEFFDSEDYEMARLKYLDAGEIFPEEKYPPKRISDIDVILEKQRLKDEEAALAELEAEYRNILSQADQSMASLQYDQAITQYQSALDIKPDEVYPKSQIERIQLLIKDEEEARLRRERRRELEREAALKRQNRSKNQVVNTDSEEQAEQFMREAREAQEKERYERIKKMKEDHQSKQSSLTELSASTRTANYEDLGRYRGTNVQFAAAAQTKDKERQKAVDSKDALESSETLRTEMERAQREVAYDQVEQTKEDHSTMITDMENIHAAKVRTERDKNKEQLEQIESWSEESKNRKLENSEKIQEEAQQVYTSNQQADAKREERAKEIKENEEAYKEYQRELSEKNMEDIKEQAEANQEDRQAFQSDLQSKNEQKVSASQKLVEQEKAAYYSNLDDKSRMADEKRQRSAEELSNVRSNEPKSYDEYFRTQLAENYPQGVTEESSTLGNKVIITRIVVKGNKGDEYKKVLDKAGNYYFKNGQSISEYTWRRETIDAFNKSKD